MTDAGKVLGLLYDRAGGFFPLDELASAAGSDRAGVDAAIEQLRGRGHEFEIAPAHGIRLVRPVRLDAHLIERDLGVERVGRSVICFDELDSTNDAALGSAGQEGADGLVVTAELQRRGRGRQGRRWLSEAGKNVLLSAVLLDSAGALPHEALTIAAGLAVAEGIEAACGLECQLKWPNDVLLEGAKVAGVLVERQTADPQACMVTGIGVNANAAPPADKVDQPATCLAESLGHEVERVDLVRALLRRLDRWVQILTGGGVEDLHSAWMSRCGMVNQRIRVVCGGQPSEGRVLDVRPLDGLILCLDDGRRIHLPAASTTVAATP
jgi:BirA family biotin operon repressor/biotin-[acetyl-CoA-carboxylase] ligase